MAYGALELLCPFDLYFLPHNRRRWGPTLPLPCDFGAPTSFSPSSLHGRTGATARLSARVSPVPVPSWSLAGTRGRGRSCPCSPSYIAADGPAMMGPLLRRVAAVPWLRPRARATFCSRQLPPTHRAFPPSTSSQCPRLTPLLLPAHGLFPRGPAAGYSSNTLPPKPGGDTHASWQHGSNGGGSSSNGPLLLATGLAGMGLGFMINQLGQGPQTMGQTQQVDPGGQPQLAPLQQLHSRSPEQPQPPGISPIRLGGDGCPPDPVDSGDPSSGGEYEEEVEEEEEMLAEKAAARASPLDFARRCAHLTRLAEIATLPLRVYTHYYAGTGSHAQSCFISAHATYACAYSDPVPVFGHHCGHDNFLFLAPFLLPPLN